MPDLGLASLNDHELHASEAAISALASRVCREGHLGVRSYGFFVNADVQNARAATEYANPDAWIGLHNISMSRPEMKALHAVAKLTEVTFPRDMKAETRNWIASSLLKAKVQQGNKYVAVFRR